MIIMTSEQEELEALVKARKAMSEQLRALYKIEGADPCFHDYLYVVKIKLEEGLKAMYEAIGAYCTFHIDRVRIV